MASALLPFPQLTSDNYNLQQVEILTETDGVKEVLTTSQEDYDKLDINNKVKYDKSESKAKCIIVQCMTDKHIEYIKDARTAKEILRSLKNVFERKSTFSKLYIVTITLPPE
ncbi:unnamed protein product [Ceutorhynchus assimilis]|uniref:Uncharacterized protein n=1 Tax=Ceutorhynchus assimilis TaxID=467358 RepID=A0A9N9QR43_9CUCU|nr:unnamed protein product [Ceutorhynchus assimilis]